MISKAVSILACEAAACGWVIVSWASGVAVGMQGVGRVSLVSGTGLGLRLAAGKEAAE
jgi:hypothetical protein